MNATETNSKVIGTRTVEGYDEPVKVYWTKAVEGRDDDGDRVTFVYTAEDCPEFNEEDPDFMEPYSVDCRTYRLGMDDPSNPDDCWDIDSERFNDLTEAIERAEEWSLAEEEDQIEREETYREGLAENLEAISYEAHEDSPERQVIAALANLVQSGKGTEVLAALKTAGLI